MDLLSDVLRVARLSGGVFLRAQFSAPWCVASQMAPEMCAPFLKPADHLIQYHYIVEGSPRVCIAGRPETAVALRPGEVVILAQNDVHLLGSDLTLRPTPSHELAVPAENGMYQVTYGGGGEPVRMICGYLACDFAHGNPVLASLPGILRIAVMDDGEGDWIRSTFTYAAQEIAAGRPGSETVLAKLSELLFIEAVRRHVATLDEGATGWLAGLRDPYVSRTLALFHGDIARPWTMDELSREVGLSRSALADRFQRLLGQPPMSYLARWRMDVAAQRLRSTSASLAQVANAVGYEAEAAFSRAFKKAYEVAPATWRRREA
ncbi:MAG TPA: AraC family transcriptional regulator [Croceibacterium sp.]|nr:AraC family transcriptional regulator [Croceibacterium sp.]